MAYQTDYTAMFKDMMGAFPMDFSKMPMDMSPMGDAFKSSAGYSEKLSKAALEAAQKSTDLSTRWTKDTLAKMTDVATVKEDPTSYVKAMTDYASAQAEMTAEYMSAFGEVAKKLQMDTVEVMMAAGKTASDEGTAAMKKTGAAAKKATQTA